MGTEKAAVFVDNSNIFKGTQGHSRYLVKQGRLKEGQYLSVNWEKLMQFLESQNDGLDIFARHFFASLPPAADVTALTGRPTEEEWQNMVRRSAQSGFYKLIQEPPFNFTLHGVPLRFRELYCRNRMRQAYFKCRDSCRGVLRCGAKVDPDECYNCKQQFLHRYEKGVDVALATQLVILGGIRGQAVDRIVLVAGDGDYKEALRFVRRELGKDVQIVSWSRPLSRDLEKLANKPTVILDNYWEDVCKIRERPPLEESPAVDEDEHAREDDE